MIFKRIFEKMQNFIHIGEGNKKSALSRKAEGSPDPRKSLRNVGVAGRREKPSGRLGV